VSRRKGGAHDDPRSRRPPRARSGRPRLHHREARSTLGGGPHVRPDLGWLPVPSRRPRRLEPACGRLGDGDASADRACPRGAQHGGHTTPAPPP
jgi:hypothetical protein